MEQNPWVLGDRAQFMVQRRRLQPAHVAEREKAMIKAGRQADSHKLAAMARGNQLTAGVAEAGRMFSNTDQVMQKGWNQYGRAAFAVERAFEVRIVAGKLSSWWGKASYPI